MCKFVSETQLILKRFTKPFESAHAMRTQENEQGEVLLAVCYCKRKLRYIEIILALKWCRQMQILEVEYGFK